MPASRTLILFFALVCAASLSACMKAPTVGFENATGDSIILRAGVNTWFHVTDCDSGQDKGAINREGTYKLQPDQRLCMKARPRKDKLDAGELIEKVDVIRDARRCVTLNRDNIIDGLAREHGFNIYKITSEICPSEASADDSATAETDDAADVDTDVDTSADGDANDSDAP